MQNHFFYQLIASDLSIGREKMRFQNLTDINVHLVLQNNFNISSLSVQDIPPPYVSTYDGPRAVTSVDGSGAYLQQNDHFFELTCSTAKCSWSLMDQKLNVGRDGAVLMYLTITPDTTTTTNLPTGKNQ